VQFGFLRPDTLYGRLCVIEEPLVSAYTAMGRLVYGLSNEKCYFDGLKTRPAHIEDYLNNDIRAYRHTMNTATSTCASITLLVSMICIFANVRW
jgi:hypothetical protein